MLQQWITSACPQVGSVGFCPWADDGVGRDIHEDDLDIVRPHLRWTSKAFGGDWGSFEDGSGCGGLLGNVGHFGVWGSMRARVESVTLLHA